MGHESYQQGQQGEEAAANFLRAQGYMILERNFHSQQGEIDLVAEEGDFLVFVEVKNYSGRSYGSPVGAIGRGKRASLTHAAKTYLQKNNIHNRYCRFDVVTIFRYADGSVQTELYRNAFGISGC